MLHIVNGDSVAEKLQQVVAQDDILVWREVYSAGPIFENMTEHINRSIRADYLQKSLGIPKKEYINTCNEQEKVLDNFKQYDEIILWFEHDLFDQTMLTYLLHWFNKQSLGYLKLKLLCIGSYPEVHPFRGLGQLTVEQIKRLLGTWQTIGQEELRLGSDVWKAYASENPIKLQEILEGDGSALPFVQEAFRLHLSRFPATYNGLSIVEQSTLQAIESGIYAPFRLFEYVDNKLNGLGMGDLEYWYHLAKMTKGDFPLINIRGIRSFPAYNEQASSFQRCKVQITEYGRHIMKGEKNWVTDNGICEWYGGVNLRGSSPKWRWDAANCRIVSNE